MSTVRSPIAGACLALLIGACSSGSNNGGSGGNVGSGGNSGDGGSTGSSNGGSSGNPSGGATGTTNGGSSGNPSGGATGNPSGGSSAKPSGGTTGNPGGATTASGGATNPGGGTTATGNGGTTGNPGGGATAAGAGGSQAGGTQAPGGSTAAGGTTAPSTALVTSASGSYWKTGTWTEAPSGNADVTVNDASTAQTWEGFGGAFNERGWSYLTTKALQDQAIQLLFGADGAHFAWGRIPIGASDYAMDRYTLDETANDTSMASFSIDRDKEKLIPYIKAAQAVKPDIRFWASPWTPPTWMKTGTFIASSGSGKKTSSNFDSGDIKTDDATLKAFALYLVKWVQAYKDEGIKIEMVSPQNEPNYAQNYPSCHWDTSTFVTFVGKYFGPAITSASLDIKVMDGTLSNPTGDADIGQKVLQDSTAKGYIGAIGVQWGMAAASQVTTLKNLAGGIPIWLSEHQCGGTIGSTANAPNDQAYGVASWGYIRDAIKNGLTAYNAWNMVLDPGGLGIDDARKWPQNALLVVNAGSITQTPAYYVFRHVSQFVTPGAKVVTTTGGDAVAFKNPDGSLVAVAYSGSAKTNYIVSIGGKKLQFAMPAGGWATVKYAP